ncbi:hypothetical protein Tco_1121518 [Tanacetum coccineum]|uniref:Uncharacterized protein n=1 Tax=Tanacetum coccineum TaxID=301880 RepID=A0ABQ5J0V0_9ASTR
MANPLGELVRVQQFEVQLKAVQSENEHPKSKVVDFTTVQNLQVQVEELKSVNESLNLSVEEPYNARALAEATLRERDEMISAQFEIKSLQTENKALKSRESELLEKIDQTKSQVLELLEKLQISDREIKKQIITFEEDKRMFLAKNEFLENVSSSVQNEYNDLLVSNDVLKQRLVTKFKFLKHDISLKKMVKMIEKEYE